MLVNRWTGSMGEGLAIGFDATGAGTVVGTAMAGLVGGDDARHAAAHGYRHQRSERLYHVNGTLREEFQPPALVDVAHAGSGVDPFVDTALQVLTKQ